MIYSEDNLYLPAGEIVSVPYLRALRHYGVVAARGTVISNSRKGGGVIEQSLADFKNGQRLRSHGAASPDHLSRSKPERAQRLGRLVARP